MNDFDTELIPRFTSLKATNTGLKVYISVGGWAAGGAIFSDMVSSSSSRTTFIDSAISFMATYSFDGIDVDWEYPAALDRDGVVADTANYVTFLKELKAACGTKYGVTVTLPSSYWYLQGFDVVGMAEYVDAFNFMSYDIHGTWDGDSPYTEAIVQPHTNLTEIIEGLDLLWRNNIEPSKVYLGLGFYGRSFTLSNPSCTTPGCAFSGGGNPGECTQTSGILSNAEIQQIISDNNLTPILNEEAAVKYIVWDTNQWVSYDDSETLQLKTTFANKHCLGGRFAWALDLDDAEDETSLSNLATGYLSDIGDDVDSNSGFALKKLAATNTQNSVNLVAYWTDCMATPVCEDGFQLETIGHGKIYDADTGAYTADGCHGGGNGYNRGFCVEADVNLNGCNWYGKPKGCGQTCPSGSILLTQNTHIGGASTGCKTGYFSSYCCDSITTSNLETCPASSASNLLTGGMSGVVIRSSGLYKDTGYGTPEECAYAVLGTAALALGGVAVLRIMAGTWVGSSLTGAVFQPLQNLVYPVSDRSTCTSTVYEKTTVYYTEQPVQTNVCDFNVYPQACAHYSSVVRRNPIDATLTCPVTTLGGRVLPAAWNKQHDKAWWSYVSSLPKDWGKNKCERDEYPPIRFQAKDPALQYTQWMRVLPKDDNQGAGKLWQGKCGKAHSSKKTEGGPINNRVCTEIASTEYTVTAFSLKFTNTGASSGQLVSDPCLPTLITDDIGFALMTQDKWYGDNILGHYNSAAYSEPPVNSLTSGVNKPNNRPMRRWDHMEAMQIPDTLSLEDIETEIMEILSQRPATYYPPSEKIDFDPESLVIEEGNSTRRATPKEIFEATGLWKCRQPGCPDERRAAGLALEDEAEAVHASTKEVFFTATVAAGSVPTGSFPTATAASSTIYQSRPTFTSSSAWKNGF